MGACYEYDLWAIPCWVHLSRLVLIPRYTWAHGPQGLLANCMDKTITLIVALETQLSCGGMGKS